MAVAHDIEHLVKQSVARDRAAFERLYEHLIDRVFSYISFRTNTKTEATDLTQDVFIELYQALEKFKFKTTNQFYAFVFVITKRKLAKHYEAHKHEREKQTDLSDIDKLPDKSEMDTESSDMVRRALLSLPEVAREIVILHHWSRYTFSEIATLLEMQESAVRVRHHRALKDLAGLLEH